MADDNSFLERDADGRWFRIEVVGPRQRVKVTDIVTRDYWYEDPGKIGVKILPINRVQE